MDRVVEDPAEYLVLPRPRIKQLDQPPYAAFVDTQIAHCRLQ
jgi:hypothetical protein